MKYIILPAVLIMSGCGYWPSVDYAYPLDFKKVNYTLASPHVANSDSLGIRLIAICNLPDKKRSRELNAFFTAIKFSVDRNLYDDTLTVDINACTVQAIVRSKSIDGVPGSVRSTKLERKVIIIKKEVFFVEGSTKTQDGVVFNFSYPDSLSAYIGRHQLKIDLKSIAMKSGKVKLPIVSAMLE